MKSQSSGRHHKRHHKLSYHKRSSRKSERRKTNRRKNARSRPRPRYRTKRKSRKMRRTYKRTKLYGGVESDLPQRPIDTTEPYYSLSVSYSKKIFGRSKKIGPYKPSSGISLVLLGEKINIRYSPENKETTTDHEIVSMTPVANDEDEEDGYYTMVTLKDESDIKISSDELGALDTIRNFIQKYHEYEMLRPSTQTDIAQIKQDLPRLGEREDKRTEIFSLEKLEAVLLKYILDPDIREKQKAGVRGGVDIFYPQGLHRLAYIIALSEGPALNYDIDAIFHKLKELIMSLGDNYFDPATMRDRVDKIYQGIQTELAGIPISPGSSVGINMDMVISRATLEPAIVKILHFDMPREAVLYLVDHISKSPGSEALKKFVIERLRNYLRNKPRYKTFSEVSLVKIEPEEEYNTIFSSATDDARRLAELQRRLASLEIAVQSLGSRLEEEIKKGKNTTETSHPKTSEVEL